MTKRSTKNALLSSVVALLLCCSMLVGTTFAWFTDSVTSANNVIVAGNLDVELYKWTSANDADKIAISESSSPVFGANILWEPGYTEVVYFSIKNNGSLALKYKVALAVTSVVGENLADVMKYAVADGAKYGDVTAWVGNDDAAAVKIVNAPGINETAYNDIELAPREEKFFALSVHMLESAGNKYMNSSITFDIRVLAAQVIEEKDGFDDTYDKDAIYPEINYGFAGPIAEGVSAVELEVRDKNDTKVASALIPAEAAAPGATFSMKVEEVDYNTANITVAAGEETKSFDVFVSGLKENNTEPVQVNLRMPAGLAPETVKLYHYDTKIESSYNPHTGYVTFKSATFSPFTVVYDAEAEYVPEVPEEGNYPTATVTYKAEHVNVELPWESFGGIAPTPGLDSKLEAAFMFACPEEIDEAYRNWYCDFFVSLDRDLGKDEIFLGGNYGTFGWVGFHNGDLTLSAGTELPLLSGITTNPWTYDMVETNVGEFLCGVGDVANALNGATFTVKLRLINPEDVDTSNSEWWADLTGVEYKDVNVVTHTFGGNSVIDGTTVVTSAAGLQDAIDNGDGSIQLGDDVDLNDLLGN